MSLIRFLAACVHPPALPNETHPLPQVFSVSFFCTKHEPSNHLSKIYFLFSYKTVNSFYYLALIHFPPFSCLRFLSSIFRDLFIVCLFKYFISSFTLSFSEPSLSCSLYKNTLPPSLPLYFLFCFAPLYPSFISLLCT